MSFSVQRERAIVIGGSIAGLLTARILANHFQQVTIIERDSLVEGNKRSGVPQTSFVHVLVKQGLDIVESLFPGFHEELITQGGIKVDAAADIDFLSPGGWGVRFDSELKIVSCSRTLLEESLRKRVLALPQITIETDTKVKILLADNNRTKVTGVTLQKRNSSIPESIFADLIVDASGRSSSLSQWLTDLGYEKPEETVIDAHIGYASRIYKIPQETSRDWQVMFIQASPPQSPYGAIIAPIEGERWIVGLMGGDYTTPHPNETEWFNFIAQLPTNRVEEAIKTAEPISPIMCFRNAANRSRHCERLSRWPDNFVALGDAVCSFNPVYGQGMTVAAMGAITLDYCLREQDSKSLQGMAQKFQKRLAKVNTISWELATGEDYRYRTTEGDKPNFTTKLMHAYMEQVLPLTNYNIFVRLTLLRVFHLLRSPLALLHPRIMILVIAQMLKKIILSLINNRQNITVVLNK